MGFQKHKRPSLFMRDAVASTGSTVQDAGFAVPVQTISLTGASAVGTTAVTNRGVTFITSTGTGAGWTLPLSAPGRKGIEKTVFVFLSGASTVPVTVRTASSSQVFFGSTKNSVTTTTGAGSTQPMVVSFVSKTSAQWAIKSVGNGNTTAVPFYTSTGATA